MAKKLAITISGAVSLGSYEAGVLFEIINAIALNNEIANEENKIEIDVLTGASAGSMTAAIAAQKLLFDSSSLKEPYDNPLYNAWVIDANFEDLFRLSSNERKSQSILSSAHIEKISKKYITDRYESPSLKSERHAASASEMHIGLALSNLNGVDYTRKYLTGDGQGFCYTKYQDEVHAKFSKSPADDVLSKWEPVREASIASGAFPFAFRTKELSRTLDTFNSNNPYISFDSDKKNWPKKFAYTDGGTFQNEPLGMAKNLVDKIDPDHLDHDNRYYLFVSPSGKNSTSNSSFTPESATFINTAVALIGAIFNQARFQDWICAEEINNKIELFDDRSRELANQITNGSIDPNSLRDASSALLDLFFSDQPNKKMLKDQNKETRQEAQERLKMQFKAEYDGLNKTQADFGDLWVDAILTFELVANIRDKDVMQIYNITCKEDELAGSPLMGFLGFFDQKFRDYDYDLGRHKAREFILGQKSGLTFAGYLVGGVLQSPPLKLGNEVSSHEKPTLNNTSVKSREKLRVRLSELAIEVLKDMGISWVIREAINLFFIKPRLKKLLGLS